MAKRFDVQYTETKKRKFTMKTWQKMAVQLVVLTVVVVTVVVPCTLLIQENSPLRPIIPDRIGCFLPGATVSRQQCLDAGCLFGDSEKAPSCFLPGPDEYGFEIAEPPLQTDKGLSVMLRLLRPQGRDPISLYGGDIETIHFEAIYYSDHLLRLRFTDPYNKRYEVTDVVPLSHLEASPPSHPQYDVRLQNDTEGQPFVLHVVRTSTNATIFDTSLGGLTFSDQFLMLSTKLPSMNLYGLGEHHHGSLRHDMDYKTWPMFARDQPPGDPTYEQTNLYGVHPFYTCVENDGNSHGVLLLNSNSMDITTMPLPALVFRTTGGILDFFLFLGPQPESVVSQYTAVIGRPLLPPYWALGFHLSRYGYNTLDNLKATVERTRKYGIPQDVQYLDIDHMKDQLDFTYDNISFAGLPDYIREEKEEGLRFIIILDPAIMVALPPEVYPTHQRALDADVYILWANDSLASDGQGVKKNNKIMTGYVWPPGQVAFPDWLRKSTRDWWVAEITDWHKTIEFDGLWVDMNEPANFGTNEEQPWNWPEGKEPWSLECPVSRWDDPPYKSVAATQGPTRRLSDKTLCMVATQGETREHLHYDVHNLYGWSEAEPTLRALHVATGQRSLVVGRSTYPGSGKWAGHWLGDNTSHWKHMRLSIIGMLEFNLFGIPFIGADICGYFHNTTEELCQRWMELGAFYPFSRSHNTISTEQTPIIDQDPGSWPSVGMSSQRALVIRYTLLPYLYTLHYHAHVEGATVARPLFHEYLQDAVTYQIDTQFLWGPAFMVSPVLEEGKRERDIYIPQDIWYDYYTGERVVVHGDVITVPAPLPHIPLHVRGGFILPTQRPGRNTQVSRKQPFGLIVALNEDHMASGDIFWDDGESIDPIENGNYFTAKFEFHKTKLSMTVLHAPASGKMTSGSMLGDLRVFGMTDDPTPVTFKLNSQVWRKGDVHYNARRKCLEVFDLAIPMQSNFSLMLHSAVEWEKLECPVSYTDRNADGKYTETDCQTMPACEWNTSSVPPCYLPTLSNYGYQVDDVEWTNSGVRANLTKMGPTLFGDDVDAIMFEVFMYKHNYLRFKFTDRQRDRYEVPIPLNVRYITEAPERRLYEVHIANMSAGAPFSFSVSRKDTGAVIFDTGIGGLTFSGQFLSLSTRLPSRNVYGLGENNHQHLRHNISWRTWPLFSSNPTLHSQNETNLHGVHPFYECLENDGQAHGVLLLTSNALDYQLLPYPALTVRTIGGVLDFFLFLGTEPESVVSQYTEVIGRPFLPPYWALGFQVDRRGYRNLEDLKQDVERTQDCGFSQDVQYVDTVYMQSNMDFTIDPENFTLLPDYVSDLNDKGLHFVLTLHPAIMTSNDTYPTHLNALNADVYIKWPNQTVVPDGQNMEDVFLGHACPPGEVAFPDFLQEKTKEWWIQEIINFHRRVQFSGLLIDMNEPTNFHSEEDVSSCKQKEEGKSWHQLHKNNPHPLCSVNKWDDPPYKPKSGATGRLSDSTVCLVARQGRHLHYDVHSVYGLAHMEATSRGIQHVDALGQRSMVISRSTFPGSGRWGGHWFSYSAATWNNIRQSIIGMLEFNLFGIPFVGSDICGFQSPDAEGLCERWLQLGAFYPLFRVYSSGDDEEGGDLCETEQDDPSRNSSMAVVRTRYRLLPYLYTLFYHAHTKGATVARPLFHEFPTDRNTLEIDSQFLWGAALLVSPVLDGSANVTAYFPNDLWYDYHTGKMVYFSGTKMLIPAPRTQVPLHIRGGYILPYQKEANNTKFSRLNNFGVIVAIGRDNTAHGDLYWDDGESIDNVQTGRFHYVLFKFQKGKQDQLDLKTIHQNADIVAGKFLDEIIVLGLDSKPSNIIAKDQQLEEENYSYHTENQTLHIDLHVAINQNCTIHFIY